MLHSPLFLWLFGRPPAGASWANVSDHVKPWPVAKTADVFNEPPPNIDASLSLMRHPARALAWDPALPELLGAPIYRCLTADAKGTRRSTASRMIARASSSTVGPYYLLQAHHRRIRKRCARYDGGGFKAGAGSGIDRKVFFCTYQYHLPTVPTPRTAKQVPTYRGTML